MGTERAAPTLPKVRATGGPMATWTVTLAPLASWTTKVSAVSWPEAVSPVPEA